MTCQEVQKQLSAFLDESLDAIRMKGIETHLNSCLACRTEANSLSDCVRRVAELPLVEPPAGFAQRVMARVREIEVEPQGWRSFIASFKSTVPIQAAAVVMIAVLAVLVYQRENQLAENESSRQATPPVEPKTDLITATAEPTRVPAKPETERAPVAQQDFARARQEQPVRNTLSATGQATPSAATVEDSKMESRIATPRRPTIQAQEVATGRESFHPGADAFGFGAPIGALSRAPTRSAPLASPERIFSPLSEPIADIEFIVRRRSFESRDQAKDEASGDPPKRSEADAAIASAVARRAVPAPASPSSIVELRWFGVSSDRYEQFRKELTAEAHIDSERSLSGVDKEYPSKTPRELLIKVIILPSER